MDDLFDGSIEDARVLRVTPHVPAGDIPFETSLKILNAVEKHLSQSGQKRDALAAGIVVEPDLIERLFDGRDGLSKKKRSALIRKAAAWAEADHRRQSRSACPAGFVDTIVAKTAFSVARNTHAARMMASLVGPSGVGKTTIFRQVALAIPGTLLVTVDSDSRSATGLIRKIDDVITGKRRISTRRVLLAAVSERLRGSGRMLIVDQAHELADSGFKALMELHDECDIPVLLSGTVALAGKLNDEDAQLGQVSSRIGLRVDLRAVMHQHGGRPRQWISAAELKRMLTGGKLKLHPDATRMLVKIANFVVGHIRRAKAVLRLAEPMAAQDRTNRSGEIGVAHIERAFEMVKGERETLAALGRVEPAAGKAVSA